MLASSLLSRAAWLLLVGAALAAPAADDAAVNGAKSSLLTTATPTLPATTTGLSAEQRDDVEMTTSMSAARLAPTDENDADATACRNTDGEFKPFCLPKNNDVVFPSSTHHITWDPSFFPGSNTTLKILGFYTTNETTIPTTGPPSGDHEAFSSENIDAGWGFWQWRPDVSLLKKPSVRSANITLRLVALPADGGPARWLAGPTVNLRYKPKDPSRSKSKIRPHHGGPGSGGAGIGDRELYVALPVVFGFAALMVVGTFWWNREVRHIDVGGALGRSSSRSRRAVGGRGKTKRRSERGGASRRDRERDREESIRLMEQGAGADSDDAGEEDWGPGWGESEAAGKKVFERLDRKRV